MAGKVTDFSALTSLADADVFYVVQTADDTDKKITAANMKADFGSASYTVETATDNKSITSTAVNYMLVFTRQATAKTITLPDAGTTGRTIKIVVTGSGAGNVTLANGDSATVGGFSVGDWEWDGTGNLTIIDDGSNWQVAEAGIWDSYDVTDSYDANIGHPQDKFTNGKIVKRGRIHEADIAESDFWTLLNAMLPTVGDCALVGGEMYGATSYGVSSFVRTSTTQINIYYLINSGNVSSFTVTSTASGTWADSWDMSASWSTYNTVWTS